MSMMSQWATLKERAAGRWQLPLLVVSLILLTASFLRIRPAPTSLPLGDAINFLDRQVASENQRRQFLSDATHELRAPLTNIQGYAGLFRRGSASDPEELAVLLDRVEGEAARMGDLLGDLTVLADHDEGRAHPQDLVDLGAIASDVATSLRSRRPQRTIDLEAEPGRAWVLGDQAALERMVRNLVDNAVEHTPDDVVVSIVVRRNHADVTVVVQDDGPGIPDDIAPRIFDRFFTAGTSAPAAARTPRRQGRGLGLSIVQTVASAHNGSVSMDTDAATGTTFEVVLPAATATPEGSQQRSLGNDDAAVVVHSVDG
jgi:two-component system OmpR family sensor kinase